MVATALSLFVGLFLFFYSPPLTEDLSVPIAITLFVIATAIYLAQRLMLAIGWSPIQKMEQNLTSGLIQLGQKDTNFKLTGTWFLVFPLLTLILLFDTVYFHQIPLRIILVIWLVSFGVTLDLLRHLARSIVRYFDPFLVVSKFGQEAIHRVQSDENAELCQQIDTIAEVALKAIHRYSPSLCNHAIDQLVIITRRYLSFSKSISHHTPGEETLSGDGRTGYTLLFVIQRLEMIFNKALKEKLEIICSQIISTLGKTVIAAAKYDISMTYHPLLFLRKCSLNAHQQQLGDIGLKTTCTLLEVAKMIMNEVDLTYLEIEETFVETINTMYEIAKETFRQDKSIDIGSLNLPFYQLKELFEQEKMKSHQDTPAITKKIDLVIEEFNNLQAVLQTMPPLPEISED